MTDDTLLAARGNPVRRVNWLVRRENMKAGQDGFCDEVWGR